MIAGIRKVLIVGTGSIAKRHIKNLRICFPESYLISVSSTGRIVSAPDLGADIAYQDLAAATVELPDFAIVASPANLHLRHTKELLSKNIPVLMEKPLCMDTKSFCIKEFAAQENIVRVGYNLRFMPSARRMKKLLEQGVIGKISTVFVEIGQYLPDWRPNQDYRNGVSARKELGGGALLELSHELDYITWFFGKFKYAFGVLRNTGTLDIDVEDNVDAILQDDNGLVAHVHLDLLQRQPNRFCKVVGEKGNLVWDLLRNEITINLPAGESNVLYSDDTYDRNQMYIDQIRTFVEYLNGENEFDSSLQSASVVMELAEALRISSQLKRQVTVGSTL